MSSSPAALRPYALVLVVGSMAAVLASWAFWVVGVVDTGGTADPNGNPLGIDYAIFHTGGRILTAGDEASLYEESEFLAALAATTGEEDQDPSRLFVNPPIFAALFMPLAELPYRTGLLIWTGMGILALGAGLRFGGGRISLAMVTGALLFYPVFVGFRLGQNSFLSLLLLATCFAMLGKGNHTLAGVALGLLMFKPQLALGTALWWTIDFRRYRRAWIAALATAGSLAIIGWLLWPDTTRAYVMGLPELVGFRNPEFLRSTFSPSSFFALILPGRETAVVVLTVLAALGGLGWFWSYWRDHRTDLAGLFALSVVLSLWMSPRTVVYDWTILLIPAIILATRRRDLKDTWLMLGGLVALVATISIRLTEAQLNSLGWAVQIAVPALALAAVGAARALRARPTGPA